MATNAESLLFDLLHVSVPGKDAIAALSKAVEDIRKEDRSGLIVDLRINCPECGELHIDEGIFAEKPHHTHACQSCGLTWRPAIHNTRGVRFLPGFRNEEKK